MPGRAVPCDLPTPVICVWYRIGVLHVLPYQTVRKALLPADREQWEITVVVSWRAMLFLRNNDRIDFGELERRVSLEITKLPSSTPSLPEGGEPHAVVSRLDANTRHADTTGETKMTDERTARRSLRSRLSVWIWAVLHARVLLRRAVAAVYTAEDANQRIGGIEDRVRVLINQVEHRRTTIEDLSGRLDTLTTTMTPMPWRLAALTSEVSALSEYFLTLTKAINEQILALRGEILFQQRRLTRLGMPAATRPVESSAAGIVEQHLDSLYLAFEDVFRGSRTDIKSRLVPYVDPLLIAGAGQKDKPIIDIGCGRGEWLELLKDNGFSAYGIDINTMMVERSLSFGLDARHADLMAHLHSIEDAARGAVTAFHVVEHLPFGTLVDFLDEALRVLMPGGVLILETPNPETMRVGATTFYNDPTHRNPLMPEVLRFIVQHRGFSEVEVLKLHPFTQGLLQEKTADAEMLNEVLFGPQDYAILARHP